MCRFVQLLTLQEALKLRMELAENLGSEVTWQKPVLCYRCLSACSQFGSFLLPGKAPGAAPRGFRALIGPKAVKGAAHPPAAVRSRAGQGPSLGTLLCPSPAADGCAQPDTVPCHTALLAVRRHKLLILNILLAPVMSLGDLNPSFSHTYF